MFFWVSEEATLISFIMSFFPRVIIKSPWHLHRLVKSTVLSKVLFSIRSKHAGTIRLGKWWKAFVYYRKRNLSPNSWCLKTNTWIWNLKSTLISKYIHSIWHSGPKKRKRKITLLQACRKIQDQQLFHFFHSYESLFTIIKT